MNNDKICLIHHFAGVGDVFFLQYVARKYLAMGYRVIWPLRDKIMWIKDYIPDIEFCSMNDDFPGKQYYGQDMIIVAPNFVYLGVMKAHLWGNDYGVSDEDTCACMSAKYDLMHLDWHDWSKGFKFNRNIDKENELYYDVLGLKDDSEYTFVNRYSNTDNRKNDVLVMQDLKYPTVNLDIVDGFSLFDWCKVIENAKEIHTVHTSVPYLIDMLDIKAEKYIMYQGNHNDDVKHIPFLKNPVYIPN